MSDDWVERFREVLARTIIQNGRIISLDANFYGWFDYETTGHLRSWKAGSWGDKEGNTACPVVSHSTPEEDEWQEFQGTFHEGDTTCHGMKMQVTCECGEIKDRWMRYEGNIGDMISAIVTEAVLDKGET